MSVFHGIESLVGSTPLLAAERLERELGLDAHIFLKLESFNPAGSAKDRIALAMILDAEKKGLLTPGAAIIEPTSGNTGIGLAAIGKARGYRVIIVMPSTMSVERQKLMKAYGAEVILTDGALGMQGSIEKAKELSATLPGSFIPGQFENVLNPQAHYDTTAKEIFADMGGKLDAFVAGIGTGGTASGCARYFKEQNPAIHTVGVEPASSPLLSKGTAGPHGLQGIGANFIPATLSRKLLDEIQTATEDEAYCACRDVARTEGLLIGISAGAALSVAIRMANLPQYKGKKIVVVAPDTGEHYLSTTLFEEGELE